MGSLTYIAGCSVVWLSRGIWDAEVAGSNPVTPTKTLYQQIYQHIIEDKDTQAPTGNRLQL